MCLSLLRNRFFLFGSFIYFLPSLVVSGYFLTVMPRNEVGYDSDSTGYPPLARASNKRLNKSEWCLGKQ
jgi:hypothetical protein